MKIVDQSIEILTPLDQDRILQHIERCGRTCYKSESRITPGSAEAFTRRLIKNGHLSVLEHFSITVKLVTDRGISHELVRHRLASYSQESTRYCNYERSELTMIRPTFFETDSLAYAIWEDACLKAERAYLDLIYAGKRPEEARAVLPTSTKTEIVMTANLREWRHIIEQRTSPAAHPQIRELMQILLDVLAEELPIIFADLKDGAHP